MLWLSCEIAFSGLCSCSILKPINRLNSDSSSYSQPNKAVRIKCLWRKFPLKVVFCQTLTSTIVLSKSILAWKVNANGFAGKICQDCNSLSSTKWIPFNRQRVPALLIKTLQTGGELILEVFEISCNVLGLMPMQMISVKSFETELDFSSFFACILKKDKPVPGKEQPFGLTSNLYFLLLLKMTTKNPDDNPDSMQMKRTSVLLSFKDPFFVVAVFTRMWFGGSLKSIEHPQWFLLEWCSWKL